ncbi:hypothetical protein DENSPDRAFT_791617 [Dentipellis sp. KUC8613]|nr:hypothetical protein DENSPDRAFT_791617 [Dentipellis sp. KUC8613]
MSWFFQEPPLTLSRAHLLNLFFTLGYVAPLYLTKYSRPSRTHQVNGNRPLNERWRDHPNVIRTRLLSVTISTAVCLYYVHSLITSKAAEKGTVSGWDASLPRLGLVFSTDTLLAYLVTPALFLGPLYVRYIGSELPFMSRWSFRKDVIERVFTWQGIRNYIVGPATEELVWRSSILAVYHLAGASRATMVFFTPISFGSAHLHHAWEHYNENGRTRKGLKNALLITLFQFTYTTAFGAHCAFIFLRTGSVFPPLVAHTFCNFMGMPQPQGEVNWYRRYATQIKVAYALGILAYIYTMRNWTLRADGIFWYANESHVW